VRCRFWIRFFKFISLRSYATDESSGALKLVSSRTKIDAESNSARLALLCLAANAGGGLDSSKIYETISSYITITSDSVIVKSASGAWINCSRAGNSYNAGGDWFYRQQMFLQGAWTTSDSLMWFADGRGHEIYHPTPDSLEAYFWDVCGYDTLDVTANKTDTTYQHWINTYDDNDNLVTEVGHTSDKSGSNKIKTDSSAFTYAQIRVSPVLLNRASPAGAAVSIIQTPAVLYFMAAEITGLRFYDMADRIIASISQPAGPTLFFDWHSLRTRPARKFYLAQLMTSRGIIHLRVCLPFYASTE
jgi:hypothetical protein